MRWSIINFKRRNPQTHCLPNMDLEGSGCESDEWECSQRAAKLVRWQWWQCVKSASSAAGENFCMRLSCCASLCISKWQLASLYRLALGWNWPSKGSDFEFWMWRAKPFLFRIPLLIKDLTLTLTGDFVDELARGYAQPWFQELLKQCSHECSNREAFLQRLQDVAFEAGSSCCFWWRCSQQGWCIVLL